MKICKKEGCKYAVFSGGYCKAHYGLSAKGQANLQKKRKSPSKSLKMRNKGKKKTLSIAKVKKDLDTLYSLWVRIRDADDYGYEPCISCSKLLHYSKLQNGHYIHRSLAPGLVFYAQNTWPQCGRCNMLDGNTVAYRESLIRIIGEEEVLEIERMRRLPVSLKKADYIELLTDVIIPEVLSHAERLGHEFNPTQIAVLNRWENEKEKE